MTAEEYVEALGVYAGARSEALAEVEEPVAPRWDSGGLYAYVQNDGSLATNIGTMLTAENAASLAAFLSETYPPPEE